MTLPMGWAAARKTAYDAGRSVRLPSEIRELDDVDGLTLAQPLVPITDLPAFPTSSVDGWALRGPGPWRVVGRVLAGDMAVALTEEGTAVEIATGAMVPEGTQAILRVEHSSRAGDMVSGEPKDFPEWREPGEEARAGEELFAAGTPMTPGLIGLAASCGLDKVAVIRPPRVALLVFGDELLTEGPSRGGRVRDALGPAIPGYLRRLGATCVRTGGPIEDTLMAHMEALRQSLDVDLICTTGGTMRGPVDHMHSALAELDALYIVNQVAVRPGFPMMIAAIPHGGRTTFVAGLPGNPQSAVVALMSLVAPLLAGLTGAPEPQLEPITLGAPIAGRGDYTHLALVRRQDAQWYPMTHVGSSMLRSLAGAGGFAVIPPHGQGLTGQQVDLVRLP